ncbi:hypothetical protein ACLKA7_008305 [Drosophila subpalustris]
MAYRASVARRSFFEENIEGLTEEQLRRRTLRKLIFTIIKIAVFLIVWMLFTMFIILAPMHERDETVVPLPPNKKQMITVHEEPTGDFLGVDIRGTIDIIKTMHPNQASESDTFVIVAVETFNIETNSTISKSREWQICVDESSEKLSTVKHKFPVDDELKSLLENTIFESLGKSIGSLNDPDVKLQVTLLSQHSSPIALAVRINPNPMNNKVSVWLGLLLLIFLYVLICFDITDRTFAALMVAMSAVGVLCMLNERPTLMTIIGWIDMETLMLLFGMMIMVSIISETGVFDYLSVFAYQLSKGKIWRLLFYLYMFTGILSAFLDNVTIVLLMVPVTIRLCEVLAINTKVVLVSVAIFSNIGGTLTPVGDPPNVIIATNDFVRESGINFGNFTLHMFPGVLLSMLLAFLMIYFMTRHKLHKSESQLRRSIEALEAQAANDRDAQNNQFLQRQIAMLKARLKNKESSSPASDQRIAFEETLKEIKSKHKIRDMPLLIKCCVTFAIVLTFFLLCSISDLKGIMLSWAAILAALLLLILADKPDVDSVLERFEWSTLIFFAALFVLMEALVEMGLIDCISDITTSIITSVDKDDQLTIGIFLVLWFSAFSSAFVDNIPITTLMLKLTIKLATNETMALPLQPLIWALAYGACFGGNGTLIGASANVVTVGIAKQHGYNISFLLFLAIGFPIMIMTVVVSTVYLLIVHCVFTWH